MRLANRTAAAFFGHLSILAPRRRLTSWKTAHAISSRQANYSKLSLELISLPMMQVRSHLAVFFNNQTNLSNT